MSKQKKNSESGLLVPKTQHDALVTYDNYVDNTRLHLDSRQRETVIGMFKTVAFLSQRIDAAMSTYGRSFNAVCIDVAKAPVGNRNLHPNTIKQYVRTHTFMKTLLSVDEEVYRDIQKSIEHGYTKFSHVLTVARSSADFPQKLRVLQGHVDGKRQYMSKRGLEQGLMNPYSSKGVTSKNVWREEFILKNVLAGYTEEAETLFAPFGTEGEHDRLIVPDDETKKTFLTEGLKFSLNKRVEDNELDNILLHMPQFNLVTRSNHHEANKKYNTFPVGTYDDFINRFEFVMNQCLHALKVGGNIAIVTWNIPWPMDNDELRDVNHEVLKMGKDRFEWMNTAVSHLSSKMTKWYPERAYRMVHIFKKL